MRTFYKTERVKVIEGDCLEVLRKLPDNSIHTVITDPPYGLSNTDPKHVADTIVRWASGDREYVPSGKGFMGKEWDAFVPPPAVWDECLRVLKPGGHLLCFAGTRTMDLMTLGIRLAGFDIRDSLAWLYGSGFPKSLNVSKAIDKAAGATREVIGRYELPDVADGFRTKGWESSNTTPPSIFGATGQSTITAPATEDAKQWEGWGTALKPAFEPIIMAQKPFKGTVANNVLTHGVGGLNIDATRIAIAEGAVNPSIARRQGAINHLSDRPAAETEAEGRMVSRQSPEAYQEPRPGESLGRWPANVVLDESQAEVLDEQSGSSSATSRPMKRQDNEVFGKGLGSIGPENTYSDAGGASRFFYVAKPNKHERPESDGVKHPTVKPLALMRYLVRLATPESGIVLDPFAGSGTTTEATFLEGFSSLAIEAEPTYLPLIQQRIERNT